MKNHESTNRFLFVALALFTVSISLLIVGPRTADAQSIDLNEIRGQREAESIKKFTDSLTLFENLVLSAAAAQNRNTATGAGLKDKGEKVRADLTATIPSLEGFVSKLKSANRFNDQFDADVNTLLGSNKVKSRVQRAGGARKFLNSGLSSSSVNNLKKEIGTAASLVEVTKSEDLCRFVGIGILAEALLQKKSTTANDKFYEKLGCDK
jgi:hypothetical protein